MKQIRKIVKAKLSEFEISKPEKYEDSIYNAAVKFAKEKITVDFYTDFAYERLGQIAQIKESGGNVKEILKEITAESDFWSSSLFSEEKKDYEDLLNRSVSKLTPVKGVYTCKRCKSDEFYIWSSQDRGGDEGMAQGRMCANCGKRKKE